MIIHPNRFDNDVDAGCEFQLFLMRGTDGGIVAIGAHGAPYGYCYRFDWCTWRTLHFILFMEAWMPDYRRAIFPGGTYFFTLVTDQRRRVLCNQIMRVALRDAIIITRRQFPFRIDAWVLLPDHLHCILTLPEGDCAYAKRWSMIKRLVTQRVGYGAHGAPYQTIPNNGVGCAVRTIDHPAISASRLKRREGTIWQRRFWEHHIRNQRDLNRCRDYLHFNPVKHELVTRVSEWPYSTFHRFVEEGFYAPDWGGLDVSEQDDFGE